MTCLRSRIRPLGPLFTLLLLTATACSGPGSDTPRLYRAPAIPNEIDGVIYESGNWESHLAAGSAGVSWGNHRAVVVIDEEILGRDPFPEAIAVTIPWRRPDPDPAGKAVIVVDAATQEPVRNALAVKVGNVAGEIVFQPEPGSAVYHVYYLPWQSTGGYYPTVTYPSAAQLQERAGPTGGEEASPSRADTPRRSGVSWAGKVSVNDPAWVARVRERGSAAIPRARTTRIQSVDDFHSFFPMEVIATPEETAALLSRAPQGWLAVAEHRDRPVRMRGFLPQHWARNAGRTSGGEPPVFTSRVLRSEVFTFQVALLAGAEPLTGVAVTFEGFPDSWQRSLTCFNLEGRDEQGVLFSRELTVPAGTVQPLWIGVLIPDDRPSGTVTGGVRVSTVGQGSITIPVRLEVRPQRAVAGGVDEPELMTRLNWLNSRAGTDPGLIIEPFEPVVVSERSLTILGRDVVLGAAGLPEGISSRFTPELTRCDGDPEPILARPLELQVVVGGRPERFESRPYRIEQEAPSRARWTADSRSDRLDLRVEGRLEYDGMLDCRITLVARTDVDVDDIALPVAYHPEAAEYMLGLGRRGGKRPSSIDWKWAVENHQEGVWLGGIHKGLQYVLRDDDYIRPLNTNFYRNQPLRMPSSWYNGGRGGIRITTTAASPGAVVARNYSGYRRMAAGDTLHFNIRFLITPFKPLDTATHFRTRFVHKYVPVDSVRAWGGTVVNIHHANEINPYINYPFFNLDRQAAYIEEAHAQGIKVKLYYTIRELTYRAHELFALRSLGDEILNDGEGGGHSWMQEHLRDHYHSAWHAWRVDDAAMLDKGTSRWTNYYVEGLAWLAANQHIDGLYLDDIAFSRETVKRMVAVLNQSRDEVVIDLHSANQFNVRDGFINSAMLYMEHFPYITRLWFGEYFEYDRDEDYWLTEVSGLPFGLMGEMLQDGGHPYRGMLYGMTARLYGEVDPRPVWRMMDDFGIAESRMLGYWLEDAPVVTDHPRVRATAYVRPGKVLVALASWSDRDELVSLTLDRQALGLPGPVRAHAPGVEGLQGSSPVDLQAVRVPAGMGLFVVVEGARSVGNGP